MKTGKSKATSTTGATLKYDVTALQMPIYFNKHGDRDPNGLMFALTKNVPILKYIRALIRLACPHDSYHNGCCCDEDKRTPKQWQDEANKWEARAKQRAEEICVTLPSTPEQACCPHPLVRPLVLRARIGDEVQVRMHNDIKGCKVGMHLVGDGYDVRKDDGSHIGQNPSSLAPHNGDHTYTWQCGHEGVFLFHDGGNYSGTERGTNVHGLFGALVVEPEGSIWRDPVTGRRSVDANGDFRELDGLELDVLPPGKQAEDEHLESTTTLANHDWGTPQITCEYGEVAHREFVIFFHDEPEFRPAPSFPNPCPHQAHPNKQQEPCDGPVEKAGPGPCDEHDGHGQHGSHSGGGHHHHRRCDPCAEQIEPYDHEHGDHEHGDHEHGDHEHGDHEHGDHGDQPAHLPPIMPISYRSEPMVDREYILWQRIGQLTRPVLNEEVHHSSWMFGDPSTPVFKAYIGDPVRIRFVHAAVKETHVFHLHLYEWLAVPGDETSPRIDAISVSPQTAHTIEPLWGAGNRQQVPGDVIWHCHLYPHFHEGMWGMFRTFNTLQTGQDGDWIQSSDPVYTGRRIGRYPDGTRIQRLLPLPGRPLPPKPTPQKPGYPLFIPGTVGQKSPIPPWPDRDYERGEDPVCGLPSLRAADMPADFDYRPVPTDLEDNAFNDRPVPGELFTNNRFAAQQALEWKKDDSPFPPDGIREVCHDVVVTMTNIEYNGHGWHDKDGHLFYLEADGRPDTRPGPKEPLFFRVQHGQIVNSTLRNDLTDKIPATEFDPKFPPCPALGWEGECALHVHMVKFDPICGDGASVGWNYISGPRFEKKMVYRWWADQEFGSIFFHDHLFANYRQKHGLFGVMIVEPAGARFYDNFANVEIVSGLQARIEVPTALEKRARGGKWFREFCIGIGDFIPMWKGDRALNPPELPGGHGDQGVMGLNYRNTPIRERQPSDPADWFSSAAHGDPFTTIFATLEDDPIWFRLAQGSHEEQHSFQIHGMRWRRFRVNTDSPLRNQQTFGIAEAFTFLQQDAYPPGDYLYKLSGADDLWLGCWGIIRAFASPAESGAPLALGAVNPPDKTTRPPRIRSFEVVAEQQSLVYRDRGTDLIDPLGLVFRVTREKGPDGEWRQVDPPARREPLVLRCLQGEHVEVTVTNNLPETMRREKYAPEVPLEDCERTVSNCVSLHADLLLYDIRQHDGAKVGNNPEQAIQPGGTHTYIWYTGAEGHTEDEPLGPVLLQDMADFRNHRHHGLVGALIVEACDSTPYAVLANQSTAAANAKEAWHGARATVRRGDEQFEEIVLFLQDGLRLFRNGDEDEPVADFPKDEDDVEKEDQGQKGFNYRSEVVGDLDPSAPPDILDIDNPATPIWRVPVNECVRVQLVGACDKPRNHSFTIHGVTWPEWRFLSATDQPRVASESAITAGTVRTFEFTPCHKGDHAYRSGMVRWDIHAGLWGIIRVE